jgi:Mycothiol maleylpyruvate isomerase N-terminal domain
VSPDRSRALAGSDIRSAVSAAAGVLRGAVDGDWSVQVPGLDFTVASVVAHAAEGPLWYAVDLWGGPTDDGAFELKVRGDGANEGLLVSLLSAASVCAASVDAAPAQLRGFHPHGAADAEGFAAMACDELLVHGYDAACGLGLEFAADKTLAARVLARLFPWHVNGSDAWQTLLWANGRVVLPGAPFQTEWRWHCAPLTEWDGTRPVV